ncbi:hypothetical protein UlMin_017103 [Ulmus minor]
MWCPHCQLDCRTVPDESYTISCAVCGRVISDDFFTEEPTFVKGPGGESRVSGNYVKSIQSGFSNSFARTLEKGEYEIRSVILAMDMDEAIMNPACSLYKVAVERNFTRGRNTRNVAIACIYIACRTSEPPKPYLLIDFSANYGENVYVLGATFLQLCQMLSLAEHSIIRRPIDPTLFIPRFTEKLFGKRMVEVSRTAMHIIASMKRDWMQTGRKPSGLCGAALYISALAHGLKKSKLDIVKIVHICEVTLTKRLIEFEKTDSGSLTIEELNNHAMELKKCEPSSFDPIKSGELLCQHKDSKEPPLPVAHGLCKSCYEDFVEISGGLVGGSDPPAFQLAERKRLASASAKQSDDSEIDLQHDKRTTEHVEEANKNAESLTASSQNANKDERLGNLEFHSANVADGMKTDGASDSGTKFKDTSNLTSDESDGGLSDIDDGEVNGYLNNDEEKHYKTIIWEEMNKEYLEEQAAKIGVGNSQKVSKPRKGRQKQDSNANPATASEAARQMLIKKRLLQKINLDMLDNYFDNVTPSNKKSKLSSPDDDDVNGQNNDDKEHKSDIVDNNDEMGMEDEELEEEYDNGFTGHEWPAEEDGYGYGYDEYDES